MCQVSQFRPMQCSNIAYHGDHFGEVVNAHAVETGAVLAHEERHLLREEREHRVHGREGILRDEDEERALDGLHATLV